MKNYLKLFACLLLATALAACYLQEQNEGRSCG